jgi:hypothetical protein
MQNVPKYLLAIKVLLMVARQAWLKNGTMDAHRKGSCRCIGKQVVDLIQLEEVLAVPDEYLDSQGCLKFTIPECPVIAAPALLFFFKRRGFSRCRVWKEDSGICMIALR